MSPQLPRGPIKRRGLRGAWRESLLLADGRELILRPIVGEDAASLRAGFALLEPEEVRLRFLHPMRELPEPMAQRLAHPLPRREFALVVAEPLPPGQAWIGAVARASIDPDGEQAEFAILVWHCLTRLGLGKLLMKRLIRWAKLKRLRCLYGDVLEENRAMLRLAEQLGFRREHRDQERGMTRVVLDLRASAVGKSRAQHG
ncbi:GNAT family N-acetyltransferase [Pseudomarimonas arenosa]|uniref:GNAT family N-acetyltransferase n=1 Tax=Pseudomarimonas arenosa TaxID=2774145 RepID=A0AAW3ZHG5_9GAMM|nr:GNAT family N-acetyltransferase [Pseudomarimonas arenosa]MBD8524562.1 GNAT family N-acetyltransferase [Pseudomarimonas arenosa]